MHSTDGMMYIEMDYAVLDPNRGSNDDGQPDTIDRRLE